MGFKLDLIRRREMYIAELVRRRKMSSCPRRGRHEDVYGQLHCQSCGIALPDPPTDWQPTRPPSPARRSALDRRT